MSKSPEWHARDNGQEAARFARDEWGKGWDRLSPKQQADTAAGELLLTIESMSDDVLVEQFGESSLPGFHVLKQMMDAMAKAQPLRGAK